MPPYACTGTVIWPGGLGDELWLRVELLHDRFLLIRVLRAGGRPQQSVQREVYAAEVYRAVGAFAPTAPTDQPRHLAEIHAAPQWLWPALWRHGRRQRLQTLQQLVGVNPEVPVIDQHRLVALDPIALQIEPRQVTSFPYAASAGGKFLCSTPSTRQPASFPRSPPFCLW